MLKKLWLILLASTAAGIGVLIGGVAGNAALGAKGLFGGSVLGGSLATVLAINIATRLQLITAGQARGAAIGGVLGFWVAAALAVLSLRGPFGPAIPVLGTALTGLGAVLGSRLTRHP
jgi:hypothetical protein